MVYIAVESIPTTNTNTYSMGLVAAANADFKMTEWPDSNNGERDRASLATFLDETWQLSGRSEGIGVVPPHSQCKHQLELI